VDFAELLSRHRLLGGRSRFYSGLCRGSGLDLAVVFFAFGAVFVAICFANGLQLQWLEQEIKAYDIQDSLNDLDSSLASIAPDCT
jgi:hypothetical protein